MVKGGGMYCIPLGSIGLLLVCTRVSVVEQNDSRSLWGTWHETQRSLLEHKVAVTLISQCGLISLRVAMGCPDVI